MNVAIVHDWLTGMRGGEIVLEALLRIWPRASLHTLFYDPASVSETIRSRRVFVSYLDRIPGIHRYYRNLLPLFPSAVESLDLGTPDVVISSSHAVAKGVRPGKALHVSYCHTPMRYIWDAAADYNPGILRSAALAAVGGRLRAWDRRTAARVHYFVSNSNFVSERIQTCYGRSSRTIPPPVDVGFFTASRREGDFFLWAGALVGYKKPDLAIEAFNGTHRRLVIAGTGPEETRLRRKAGPNVAFRGWLPRTELRELYRSARALVFPGKEDFGMVAVEARAAGCPVIAYDRGGAAESLVDGANAVLFSSQTVGGLRGAMDRFDAIEWSQPVIRAGTEGFSREKFEWEMESFVRDCWDRHVARAPARDASGR